MSASPASGFRQRLLSKELLLGTFVKTPSPIIAEVLGLTELDVICLDAEHAPFGRLELDSSIHALRAMQMPSLVRIAAHSPEYILQALDCGAAGVLVPHVSTATQAEAVVAAAHFGEGGRGYAGSTRAAAYTTRPMPEHLANSEEQTTVIVQIEDPAAVEAAEEIGAVAGVDCLFVGRIDLTVALKAGSANDSVVMDAVERVCAAGRASATNIGMFISAPEEAEVWREKGVSLFLLGSDHGFIINGANAVCTTLKT